MEGSFCHHFLRIFVGVCSRVEAEVVCPCPHSSSDPLVGRDWAVAKLMGTHPEVGLQSAQVVVGQRADSLSSLELDVWLAVEAEELVAMLALRKAQCSLRTLLGDTPRSPRGHCE